MTQHPYDALTPDVVLDALSTVGLHGDGRLLALSSYENRVYQLGSSQGHLVLKFYRPERWSDEQIGEEHQFAAELAPSLGWSEPPNRARNRFSYILASCSQPRWSCERRECRACWRRPA